ncbi:OmpA family protein [Roseobacter sp.]|uniref:OmpA family protein n=1 Tax=Roseobacter sp. TaxID=1907202 RepID=UPI00385E4B56
MNLLRAVLLAILVSGAGHLSAADLALPVSARMTVERATDLDSFNAPVAAYASGAVPTQTLEGSVTRTAWRLDNGGQTPLQLMAPLRSQIEALGYAVVFECESKSCGGFDFRFLIEVLPGPNMYVNIASFRYLTAFKGPRDDPTEAITVLVSSTAASAYVQIINATTNRSLAAIPDVNENTSPLITATPGNDRPGPEANTLLEQGFVILRDLEFASGTSRLGPGPFPSLAQLSDLLAGRGDLRVALVGHTDTVGNLEGNIALSRERARAVRRRLIEEYGIDAARLDAEGMGYLAPVASNLTPEGRSQNRRVEAILLNVE